jgi:hypothetical protein
MGANYIGATERPKVRSLKTKLTTVVAAVAAATAAFVGLGVGALALDASTTQNVTSASAGLGISCTTVIGGGMDQRGPWGSGPLAARIYEDLPGRTFALNEVVGSPAWTNYTGIGEGPNTDFFIKSYADVIDPLKLNGTALDDGTGEGSSATTPGILPTKYATNWAEVEKKLTAERNTGTCFWEQTFVTNIANGAGLGLANAMQMFVTWVSTNAFNSSFICDPNSPGTDGCIDLVQIIGGRDDAGYQSSNVDGGLIGNLTNSIYKPLVIIVVVVTALGIAYTGIVKRRFREALTQTVWLALSFIIGLALLLNPSMLAKAPMIATNAITGCVIGSFNGANCFDGSTFSTPTADGVALTADSGVCISEATTSSPDQITGLAVNSMGCTIWKTFILQNYAKGAFGVNLDQLDVKNAETVAGKAAIKAGVSPDKFCYTLQTNGSIDQYDGEWLETKAGGAQICNLAVYNMLMQMKVTPTGVPASDEILSNDPAWYDLVVTTASSEKMWPIWTTGGQQFVQGFVAVASVLLGGILIVIASISALMYYLTAIVLLIFAPLFILIGINPGRGKKIMLGWLESILASLLKYLASALFLLVALALYSAVLGAADPMAALLFVVILSMVLWMYRKEIVDTFSKVSLGGERMANMLDKQIPIVGASGRQLSDKAAKMPGALAGGAIGGMIAGGFSKAGEGMKIAGQNELRSAPGLVGRASQAKERQLRDNQSDFTNEGRKVKETAAVAETAANTLDAEASRQEAELRKEERERDRAAANAATAAGVADKAELDLERAKEEREATSSNETTAKLEFDASDLRAEAHTAAVNAAAEAGQADQSVSSSVADYRKLMMSVEQLGAKARIADHRGDTEQAITLRVERDALKEQAVEIRNFSTYTEGDKERWVEDQARFDQLLEQEQMRRPELITDTGAVRKYSGDEYAAAGIKLADATKSTLDADIRVSYAADAVGKARVNEINFTNEITERAGVIDARQGEAEEIRQRAAAAKVEAAAIKATADKLFDQSQALGPGNLPTRRKTEAMMREAMAEGEVVRDTHSTVDRVLAGEAVEAPQRSVASTAADLVRPGGNLDEKVEGAIETRGLAADRTKSSQRAVELVTARVAETTEEARLAARELHGVKTQTDDAEATAAMTEQYAAPHRNELRKFENQIDQLDELIKIGKPVTDNRGEVRDVDYLTKMKEDVETRLATKAAESADVISRADNARAEAEAKRAQLREAEVAKAAVDTRLTEAKDDREEALRNERARVRQEAQATKRVEKLTDSQKQARGILNATEIEKSIVKTKDIKTPADAEKNASLTKLVEMADKLAKNDAANDAVTANKIAAIQSEISKLANNIDKNPRANEGVIDKLETAVNELTKTNESSSAPRQAPAESPVTPAPAERRSDKRPDSREEPAPRTDPSGPAPRDSNKPVQPATAPAQPPVKESPKRDEPASPALSPEPAPTRREERAARNTAPDRREEAPRPAATPVTEPARREEPASPAPAPRTEPTRPAAAPEPTPTRREEPTRATPAEKRSGPTDESKAKKTPSENKSEGGLPFRRPVTGDRRPRFPADTPPIPSDTPDTEPPQTDWV